MRGPSTLERFRSDCERMKDQGLEPPFRDLRLGVYSEIAARHTAEAFIRHAKEVVAILDKAEGK